MNVLSKNRLQLILLFLLLALSLIFPHPSFAGCSWEGTWSDTSNQTCNYKCKANYGGGGYGGIYVSGLVTETCIQQDSLGGGQYNVWAEFTQCSSDAEAKQYCNEASCTSKTGCSIFTSSSDQTCCNAVNNNCSQCLNYNNACTPPEISNIDWQCVYANNCQDSVWATGCRNIPASTAPICNGSLPAGTYYPGQIIKVGGEVVLKNTANPKINTANVLLGSTYVNWDGRLTPDPPTSCNALESTGVKEVGSFASGPYVSFNDSTINVTKGGMDYRGLCNADPYRAKVGTDSNVCSPRGQAGCTIGTATAAHNPNKVDINFDWLVPNIDQAATAQVTGSNNAGNCSYSSNFNIVSLACQNLRVGNGSGTILTPPPGTITSVRFTSTNPKSSYTASVSCNNGLSLTNAGFPYSYAQRYGSSTFTNYDYVDDNSSKKLPDNTNIISYSGGGWTQIPVNNDPNADGSRHFNNRVGKTVTVYFIGESVTVYGWAWERTAKNTDGTVTKPQFTADIDGTGATISSSYLGNGTCTFRAPTTSPSRNTYAPICTITPTTSRTGIRKLTLVTENDNNLYFDGIQINTPFILPFTIPTNVPSGSCTFQASVANRYYTAANQAITSDTCNQNFSLNISGRPNVAVAITGAPTSCTYGTQVNTSTTVSNSGSGNANNVNLTIKLDGTVVQSNALGTLAAGASTQVPYSRPCTDSVSSHTISAEIGPVANDVTTADDSNSFVYTIVPRASYFQTIGGGITSLGTIKSPLPSVSEYLSKNSGKPDAGIISSPFINTLDKGLGHFSQNGTANPGWNRGATSTPRIDELTYTKLYNTVLTNAGVDSSLTNIRNLCNTATALAVGYFDSGSYRIFCYKNTGEIAQAVNAPTTNTSIIIPHPSYSTSNPNPGNFLVAAGKKVILFITPNPADLGSTTTLSTPATVTVDPTNTTGLVTIVNGDINATSSTRLDGLYLFSGQFNSGSGSNPLLGSGSLIGTGTINLTRTHGTTGTINPAELWTYQPKYLWLFRNILTQPSYSWKELPPE